MDVSWLTVVVSAVTALAGAVGGGGIIYWRENKKGKQIENKGKEVDVQHNVVQDYQALVNWLEEHMKEYKQEVDTRVAAVKIEVGELREEIYRLKQVVSEAYRCQYPPTLEDCPVIKAMKASRQCEECRKKGANECLECKE